MAFREAFPCQSVAASEALRAQSDGLAPLQNLVDQQGRTANSASPVSGDEPLELA
jgi:hypothetical protein